MRFRIKTDRLWFRSLSLRRKVGVKRAIKEFDKLFADHEGEIEELVMQDVTRRMLYGYAPREASGDMTPEAVESIKRKVESILFNAKITPPCEAQPLTDKEPTQ